MSIIEKFSNISMFMTGLFDFVQTDKEILPDFEEFLKTLSVNNPSQSALEGLLVKYIFERRIDGKSIMDFYEEKSEHCNKELLDALKKSVSGYFEIKKLHKNGFLLYNLLNEKEYDVVSLVKMTNFRGVYAGLYVNARVFNLEGTTYLLEISDVYEKSVKNDILRYLVAKIIQEPECAYIDNEEKEQSIKQHAKNTSGLFQKIFGTNELITKNEYVDELLGRLNESYEHSEDAQIDVSKYIHEPEEYKYFKVSEFQNDYNNFLENSLGGFSAHSHQYDVGIIAHETYGIYVLPFWGTINKIYETSGNIEGAKECVKYYLENDKIPLFVIEMLEKRYNNFLELTNTLLEKNYTFDEYKNQYKKVYMSSVIYSPTSVLYTSKVFLDTLEVLEIKLENEDNNKEEIYKGVGRNDLCPCGSGKKYKNCCLGK